MNIINLSFWSTSRSSVKSTRRKVFHRASSAAKDDATPTLSSKVNKRSRTDVAVSIFAFVSQANASQSPARCKARVVRRCSQIKRACADGSLCRLWLPVILSVSDERKITQEQTTEEKFHDGADGCARRAADALWPLHDFRIQGPRAGGRSGCAGTRKFEKQNRAACARALAMPDWRSTHVVALRLPRPVGTVAEENRPGTLGNSGVLAAGRPGNRFDEQAPRLRTPGRRDGHG